MKILHKILFYTAALVLLPQFIIILITLHTVNQSQRGSVLNFIRSFQNQNTTTELHDHDYIDFRFNVSTGDIEGDKYSFQNVYVSKLLSSISDLNGNNVFSMRMNDKLFMGTCRPLDGIYGRCSFVYVDAVDYRYGAFLKEVLAVAIICTVLTCVGFYFILKKIMLPLERLTLEISTKKDDYDFDIRNNIRDEVGVLIGKLNEYQKELKKSAHLAAMGQITAHIAHDMRSPLSVLKDYAETDSFDGEKQEPIKRSVNKLLKMAGELVDYSKAGKVEKEICRVDKLIRETVLPEITPLALAKGAEIEARVDSGLRVNSDGYRLGRVLVNLLINAIQAVFEGTGRIILSVFVEGNSLRIEIQDNGRGIEKDSLHNIFDSFYTKGKRGGTGLGLSYCKQVVEAHGGAIDVDSEEEKGTTFTIKIPNCVVENEVAADVVGANNYSLLRNNEHLSGARTAPLQDLGNVLIADDDFDIRLRLIDVVNNLGGNVVFAASSPREIIDSVGFDYSAIDTAIVDYQFKGDILNGVDVISYLKKNGVRNIHLCTGHHDDEEVCKQAKDAGAVSIIPKPFDEKLLIFSLHRQQVL